MLIRLLLLSLISSSAINAQADFDVDDADSLDFSSFHSSKKPAAKVIEQSQDKTNNASPNTQPPPTSRVVYERYSLTRSDHTPYSAFYVIEALHRQLAQHCPQGWLKEKEWSQHIEASDYLLHYQYHCLTE
ncbi:hypothetical protein NO559_15765 [Dasania sp. GY-MA-18]|uniref:Uncharacterized protein n=1 Tax=Dasania phycosphaerae TaxID=2950436 RepID=A0A9J6RQN9_9GAMM|nr:MULTISPECIES: hypothetical protein [Dasania]MCR8924238.1 hypothetical protein [Dasania sp. GY-MA-18]MCZ0866891.1 hypothetical protein [Dasania phycosphaerae]MCZ0870395.1 hypothetical protein [Dasania phycosphaerae]